MEVAIIRKNMKKNGSCDNQKKTKKKDKISIFVKEKVPQKAVEERKEGLKR